eukprot:gene32550-17267_t
MGMMVMGVMADVTGRKWGSRVVAIVMLSGSLMLMFTAWAPSAFTYFSFFMIAQTWYGFGVGGEYPLASSSAAEQASSTSGLDAHRGRQVLLVFSNQGMGSLVNSVVILLSMLVFQQTDTLTKDGSRRVLILMYAVGAAACVVMVAHRAIYLKESKITEDLSNEGRFNKKHSAIWRKHVISAHMYWPRQLVASVAWVANDFAFYGNKLFQSTFISILYPLATQYEQQKWTVLNCAIALMGYYAAALMVDKPWYGRRRMQNVGFAAMFILYLTCYLKYEYLTSSKSGLSIFQAIYYLSSFFNQFGPNATTWLVAGEMFPTDVRAANHGFAATMGKLGALIAGVWFSYVGHKVIFLLSALFAIVGIIVTTIWMADTTGLQLSEYDRMQHYVLEGRFQHYHGEAINPKHLSYWERRVLHWDKGYNPEYPKPQGEETASLLTEMTHLTHMSDADSVHNRHHIATTQAM